MNSQLPEDPNDDQRAAVWNHDRGAWQPIEEYLIEHGEVTA